MFSFASVSATSVDTQSEAGKQSDNTLSVETLWQLSRIGQPVVSPDGNFIVAPVTHYDVPEDKGATQLFLFDVDGKGARALTAKGLSVSQAVFSPNSEYLAFVSKRNDDDAGQIYILPMTKAGEATRLTEVPTGASSLKWVGQHLYFTSSVWPDKSWEEMTDALKHLKDKKVSAWQWNALPYSSFDRWIDEERQAHVFRVPSTGGDIQGITQAMGIELPRSSHSASSYDIDPTETYIAFNANGWENQVDPKTDLFIGKIGESEATNITSDNVAPDFSPTFSPDGKTLAYLSRQIAGFYADTARIKLYDIAKSTTTVVNDTWDRSMSNIVWAANGRGFYSSVDDAGTRRLYYINARNGKFEAITKATNFSTPQILSSNYLVATNESFLHPAQLVKVAISDGDVMRLDSFNDDILSNVELGSYESVTYQGADGKDIQMWVHYPPGFDKNKKYPLFLLIHGGPHNAITDGFHYRWNAQTFASWGYVTAWPNFHGSSGYGQAFADAINPDWKTKPLEDVRAATDWFMQQEWIDTDRMVAGGASYGGYLSSILLGTEHPFKALLIHAAVYNMYSQMAADFSVHSTRFGSYWENPDIYKSISPHYFADKFATPTLVTHGQLDYRVPVGQGFELFRTLQTKGIESRMIYFPDENHWILKPNNSIYWYNEVKDWMTHFAEPGAK
ncbi:S9 family peptidase [Glaciecola sp. XM2]|uniref:S9 family peptidase n=1 Tax=Glaciecola sp. XM2 TaxID=1914931 RepID=UPI001BDE3E5C|nr:S9 family peptidase [Glaciecola sp. XM2]MBT1452439.1 S9 family peptidase [Glaciecola sp. XM2]